MSEPFGVRIERGELTRDDSANRDWLLKYAFRRGMDIREFTDPDGVRYVMAVERHA